MKSSEYHIDYPLHAAILLGNTDWAASLIFDEVDVNLLDCDGRAPLALAAAFGEQKIATLLLSQPDIQVNVEGVYSKMLGPYEMALKHEYLDIAQQIVQHPSFDGDLAAVNALIFNKTSAYHFLEENQVEKPYADARVQLKLAGHRYELKGVMDAPNPYYDSVKLTGCHHNLVNAEIYDSVSAFVATYPEKVDFQYSIVSHLLDTLLLASDFTKTGEDRYTTYLSVNEAEKSTVMVSSGWTPHSVCFVFHDTKLFICNRGYGWDGEHGVIEYEILHPEMITSDFMDMLFDTVLPKDVDVSPEAFILEEIHPYLGLVETHAFEMPVQVVGNCVWASTAAGIYATLIAEYEDYGYSAEEAGSKAYDFYQNWVEFDAVYGLDALISDHQTLEEMLVYEPLLEKIVENHHDGENVVDVKLALSALLEFDAPEIILTNLDDLDFEQAVQKEVIKAIDCYDNSNVLIDMPYFYLDKALDYLNLGFAEESYTAYYDKVSLGEKWQDFIYEHPEVFSEDLLSLPSELLPDSFEQPALV